MDSRAGRGLGQVDRLISATSPEVSTFRRRKTFVLIKTSRLEWESPIGTKYAVGAQLRTPPPIQLCIQPVDPVRSTPPNAILDSTYYIPMCARHSNLGCFWTYLVRIPCCLDESLLKRLYIVAYGDVDWTIAMSWWNHFFGDIVVVNRRHNAGGLDLLLLDEAKTAWLSLEWIN